MTLTNTIDRIGGSASDVSVKIFDRTDLKQQGLTEYDPKTGTSTSVYTLQNGDPLFPTTVTVVNQYALTGAADRQRHIIVRLDSWATVTSDVSGVDPIKKRIRKEWHEYLPNCDMDNADLADMSGNLFSLLWTTLTSKVPDTAFIAAGRFARSNWY